MRGKSLLICLLLSSFLGISQQRTIVGFLPAITSSIDFKKEWKLIFKAESRLLRIERDQLLDESEFMPYNLTDVSGFLQRKIAIHHSLAAGYQVRGELNEPPAHRFIAQYNYSSQLGTFRSGHRVRLDGTLVNSEWTKRLRYRYSVEVPFDGERVDNKEFYALLNAECLIIRSLGATDLELRFVPIVGYKINDIHKMELGPDLRLADLLSSSSRLSNWITATWFFSF